MPHSSPLFILGATAVGKSELALRLAREQGAAILCMDSMQVYRGADIGTSKPSAAERAEILHGGIDLVEIGQPFSVADYLKHAEKFLAECRTRNQPVIIVGGTGLYYRALTEGFSSIPPTSVELRNELALLTVKQLQTRLEKTDPQMMPYLDLANPRRLARAIAVKESTGVSLRDWQQEETTPLVEHFNAYHLHREKDDLNERIEKRVNGMISSGWKSEVDQLLQKYGAEVIKNFVAIGYRELADTKNELSTATKKIITATRQYAKRQLTWFKKEPNLKQLKLSFAEPTWGGRLS